jgi:sulfoacetaldehyde acetyltransferase
MSPRMAWRAIQSALPKEAIISSDIGNNCAIGNAYPTFEQGRKYLAPGLFGPCGYGLPAIVGAKIGLPDTPVVGFAGDGAFGIAVNEMTAIGRDEWPPSPWSSSATTSGARKSATRRSGSTTISSAPSWTWASATPDRQGLRAEGRVARTMDELTERA